MRPSTLIPLVGGGFLAPALGHGSRLPHSVHERQQEILRSMADGTFERSQGRSAGSPIAMADTAGVQAPNHERLSSTGAIQNQRILDRKHKSNLARPIGSESTVADGSVARKPEVTVLITSSEPPETTDPVSAALANMSSPTSSHSAVRVSVATEEKKTVLWAGVAIGVVGAIMCSF